MGERTIPTIIGNLATGLVGGFLVGLVAMTLLSLNGFWVYIVLILPAIYGLYQGYKHPMITEIWGFVLPIALLFIVIGNGLNGSLSRREIYLLSTSVGLLILNLLSGDLRVIKRRMNKAQNVGYRTLGRR